MPRHGAQSKHLPKTVIIIIAVNCMTMQQAIHGKPTQTAAQYVLCKVDGKGPMILTC